MKKLLIIPLLFLLIMLFAACGEEKIDPSYTNSSVVISSFTEIAGENPDDFKENADNYCYIYKIRDGATADAAYALYRDYLDKNFEYSMIDSAVVADGYNAVYYADDGSRIEFSEAVNKDGSYVISVTVPL